MRRADLDLLDRGFRAKLEAVIADLAAAGSPLKLYETIRSPARQKELFARGRDPDAADFGRTVTKATAYESLHQWGHAADLVGFVNGRWTWDIPKGDWLALGVAAKRHGLETLSFEKPHIQTPDFRGHGKIGPMDDAGWLAWLKSRA
jgi:hypothetical protein